MRVEEHEEAFMGKEQNV